MVFILSGPCTNTLKYGARETDGGRVTRQHDKRRQMEGARTEKDNFLKGQRKDDT